MQLVWLFVGTFQQYSPYCPQVEAVRPQRCPVCGSRRPEGKGTYCRQVWLPQGREIQVRCLRCRRPGCRTTISLLPSFCVPFKRYCSETVESCLASVLECGQRVEKWACDNGVAHSTAAGWVRQFRGQSGLLSTEGAVRLGVRQPKGGHGQASRLWSALRAWSARLPVLASVP